MNDMDVEFNQDNYEISIKNGELQVGVDVELTRYFYDLDLIHTLLVLSR